MLYDFQDRAFCGRRPENTLRRWELAALLALCLSLCWSTYAAARQARLTQGIIRLHVVAASDAPDEQALKLRVRDAVLELLTPALAGCESPDQARACVESCLPRLLAAAQAAGEGRAVRVEFSPRSYGTRQGEGYTLPAGTYHSLRVILGEGEGHNWWGVVYPQLIPAGVADYAQAVEVLGADNARLVYEGEDGYVLRFRLLEWVQAVRDAWQTRGANHPS